MINVVVPKLPRPLNEPKKISVFTLDEIIVFVVPFFLTCRISTFWLALIVAPTFFCLYKYLVNNRYGNMVKKGAYWFLPANKRKYKCLFPSNVRETIG